MKFYKYLHGIPKEDYTQWQRVDISFWEWLKMKPIKRVGMLLFIIIGILSATGLFTIAMSYIIKGLAFGGLK